MKGQLLSVLLYLYFVLNILHKYIYIYINVLFLGSWFGSVHSLPVIASFAAVTFEFCSTVKTVYLIKHIYIYILNFLYLESHPAMFGDMMLLHCG